MSVRLRVVLADDHTVLRVGLRAFLEEQDDPVIEVVGEANNGTRAIELVEELSPDLLVLDIGMPGLGGMGTAIELRRRGSPVRILTLTQYGETVQLRRMLDAGVNGYILKSARGDELLSAIRAVVSGGTYIDANLAGSLLGAGRNDAPASDGEGWERLTPRERQVLELIAEGYSNKEIAVSLGVAVKTAMAHRANLMDKLGIHNRSKLIQFAIRVGLVSVD